MDAGFTPLLTTICDNMRRMSMVALPNHRNNPSQDWSDQELVAAFLDLVGNMPSRQIARTYEGITPDDLTRWRRGSWKRISGDKRDALIRILSDVASHSGQAPYDPQLAEAEEWLSIIINPDLLRRQAGTPTGRDIILGIESFLFDLDWPLEKKNEVDALLNQIAEDAKTSEH